MALRLALAQVNPAVGDLRGNSDLIVTQVHRARESGAELIVLPEMCLSGYPPEDLLLKRHFLEDCRTAMQQLAARIAEDGGSVIVGSPELHESQCHNTLAVLEAGQIVATYRKGCLPNYGVFDEKRYFEPGTEPCVIERQGVRIALTICEDIWSLSWLDAFVESAKPFDLLINASASPFHAGKINMRKRLIGDCARHFGCTVAYCNLVGGQDELVFDGRSMIADAEGRILHESRAFCEDLLCVEIEAAGKCCRLVGSESDRADDEDPVAEVHQALVLGTRDYVRKNGFSRVLIGLSGGIDSSLTAAIAVDALGRDNVVGITMPSRFNTAETISDAERTAQNLGIEFQTIPIAPVLDAFHQTLGRMAGWDDSGIAYENLQARIRGTILMSLSNQLGLLVLTTGNKSETAVGYSTLYGDTAGGFAVIKDVPKTMVYAVSRYINRIAGEERIPDSVIRRIPSAELRPNQKDADSLPDYDVLDRALKGYVELDQGLRDLLAEGLDEETVRRVIGLVDRNEYKRRQCPPGIKITPKAFGRDRRMPITNRYQG